MRRDPTPLDLAVDALAAYRVTRLLTEDDLTEPLRQAISARSSRTVMRLGAVPQVCRCGHTWGQHLNGGGSCTGPIGCPCDCTGYQQAPPPTEELPVQPWAFLAAVLGCPWCAGVWAGIGIRLLPRPLRRALAVAAVASLIATNE